MSCTLHELWSTTYLSYAFSALTLLVGRQEGHPACKKTEWWGAGVVICLELGADVHTAQLMPLPLTVSCFTKIQIDFAFWYRLTRVVPEKGPLNVCVCVCVIYYVPINAIRDNTAITVIIKSSSMSTLCFLLWTWNVSPVSIRIWYFFCKLQTQ